MCKETDNTCESSLGITGLFSELCAPGEVVSSLEFSMSKLLLETKGEEDTFSSGLTGLVFFKIKVSEASD